GMKIICDLVINHTSDQHEWFKESRSSLDNPKRDWYIWKRPKYDAAGNRHPPNNWQSYFSGSAWEYDEPTGEYYLRLFAKGQPDLNWENEECRKAIYDSAIRFWLNRGVDGFRIDVAGFYSKEQSFTDAPITYVDQLHQPSKELTSNGPRIHEFHQEMNKEIWSEYDIMTVGEMCHWTKQEALKYVSASRNEMNMMFIFDVVELGTENSDRFRYFGWNLIDFKNAVKSQSDFIKGTDAWSTVFIENHDQPRSITRFGNDKKYHTKSGKLIAMLQTTLTGTLFIYQGQEIGMTNLPRSWSIEEYKDVYTTNYYNEFKKKYGDDADFKQKEKQLMDVINMVARDHSRSPVQWNASANAGFTSGKPWMKVNDNYTDINVKEQQHNPNSLLKFYQKMLKLRKEYKDLFIYGSFEILDYNNDKSFTFIKEIMDAKSPKAYVVLNFSNDVVPFERLIEGEFELVASNLDSATEFEESILSPYEGRVYIVE
ncbi:Alpha-glucosidase, partial [Candida tropicalis]